MEKKRRRARRALFYALLGSLSLVTYEAIIRTAFPVGTLGVPGQILGGLLFLVFATGLVYTLMLRASLQIERERLQAEESFRRSEALLRMASRISRTGAWVVDVENPVITWSEEVRALHEVSPDFVPTAENNLSFYAPEYHKAIIGAFTACIRDGVPFNEEFEIITAKGRRLWVRTMGEPIREPGGAISRVQGAIQDISEHKDAETSLMQSGRRFHQLADSMPLIVWTATPDGRMDYVSRAFTEYTGIPFTALRGERWTQAVHAEDLERASRAWKDAARFGGHCEIEFRLYSKADDGYRWHLLRATPIHGDDGRIINWYGTATDIHASKQAEEKARDLAAQLTSTLESITDAFFTLDLDWRLTYVNSEGERLMQSLRGEMLGKNFWEKFPDMLNTPFEVEYRKAMKSGNTSSFETFYAHRNMWFSVRVYPSGLGLAVYFNDITHRHNVREALRESRRQLAGLLDNFPGIAYRRRLDAAWTTLFMSEGARALTGYPPGDLLNNVRASYWDLIEEGDRGRVSAEIRKAAEESKPFDFEYGLRARDGGEKRVWERGRFIADDEGGHIEGFIMDISARKRAEAERERLMAAVEQMGEIILITDPQGTIQYVNPAFERVTGYSREEAAGQNPRILKSGEHNEAFYAEMWETLRAGRTWRGRMVNQRKDGTRFTEEGLISPVFDAAGRLVNYVAVKNDITAQLSLEEQYRQSQKMEAVGRLAGGVAHDFNNMLTVILLRTELALRRTNPAEPMHGFLTEIQDSALRSAELTRQLLAYARQQPVQPKILVLNAAIEGTLQILRRLIGENIDLTWMPGSHPWSVRVDPVQVDQIVANLCVNARDAIDDVGVVTIETQNVVFDEAYCRVNAGFVTGEYVMLAVSDTGRGMDRETQAHIFEPFYTTKEVGKGTGLGLATVYGIVKQNQGFINVYSEPGHGTAFRIYLPRHAGSEGGGALVEKGETPRSKGETILLVEDEPMILEATAEILRDLGYVILEANRPADALEIAANHPAEIHLVLTDVVMPEMNGRDLVEKLQAMRPTLRRVFMSGYTANVIMQRGIADREAHFIQKPFSTGDLALTLRAALEAPEAPPPG